MTDSKTKLSRRRHSAEVKALVLRQCAQPGASVAAVAMAHGINANIVHKWRRLAAGGAASAVRPEFIALPMPPSVAAGPPGIRIELRRGATSVAVDWPLAAADACAAWLGGLLR